MMKLKWILKLILIKICPILIDYRNMGHCPSQSYELPQRISSTEIHLWITDLVLYFCFPFSRCYRFPLFFFFFTFPFLQIYRFCIFFYYRFSPFTLPYFNRCFLFVLLSILLFSYYLFIHRLLFYSFSFLQIYRFCNFFCYRFSPFTLPYFNRCFLFVLLSILLFSYYIFIHRLLFCSFCIFCIQPTVFFTYLKLNDD